jgi:ElaB/YqjD/DUF883 family membrane-anchored ribosome-binding protein
MEQAAVGFNHAKDKMAQDLKMIISDGEDLLKAAANASGEGLVAARAKFSKQVTNVKAKLADVSQPVIEGAGRADDYVKDNPWTAIGVAAIVGMLIGFLAAKR